MRLNGAGMMNPVDSRGKFLGYPEEETYRDVQSNFLRKGQGIGGSPTMYELGFQDGMTGE